MMTFSINIGLDTESTSYPVQDNLDNILGNIENNESKLVNPRDIRDAVFSLWTSVPFKQTTASGSSISYIGLDSNNPSERDIKKKIFLGKRSFSGTYSYNNSHNIMNDTLLSSDVDVFLYNTKIDTQSQLSTKISILSGSNSSLYTTSPYIQSQLISGTTQSLSFDLVNISDINIQSVNSGWTGSVSINNIIFPTNDESGLSASDGKILFMESGELIWDNITYPVVDSIGVTGSQLDIYGTPTYLNGYPLEFIDSRSCPIEIGDIKHGDTFTNIPLSEILRRMLYDYLPPTSSIEIIGAYQSGYVEVGTFPTPTLQYIINKKTFPTQIAGLSNMIPSIYPAITDLPYTSITGSSSGIVVSPITATSTEFKVTLNDGTQSTSSSTYITGIYPYFYGFSTVTTMNSISLNGLTKLNEPNGDKIVDINGSGNLYFIYDSDYGTLSNIYDEYGNTSSATFSHTQVTLSSPSGLWAGKDFYVYQWNGSPQIGPPSVNYEFKY